MRQHPLQRDPFASSTPRPPASLRRPDGTLPASLEVAWLDEQTLADDTADDE